MIADEGQVTALFVWLFFLQFLRLAADFLRNSVIGTVTLVIEMKFIHTLGLRGRVTDLVVDTKSRGCGVGTALAKYALELARDLGIYKVSMACVDSLVTFAEGSGFPKDVGNNVMVRF